jgi:hypothetical protein
MADCPAAANGIISEEGGPYYHASFRWVPRVGELIDLTSVAEIRDKRPDESRRFYEVVAVVHVMHDVVEGGERPRDGHHSLKVVVKKSSSEHLRS